MWSSKKKPQRVTQENFLSAWMDIRMVRGARIVAAKVEKCPIAILTIILNTVLSKALRFLRKYEDFWVTEYVGIVLEWFVAFILNCSTFVLSLITFGFFGTFPKSGCGRYVHMGREFTSGFRHALFPNHDCLYSFANLDLSRSDAIITMPEADEMPSNKNGIRYQSVMIIAHGKFFPISVIENKKGHRTEYTLTKNTVGAQFCMIMLRTQVNPRSDVDVARAALYQKRATLFQENCVGSIFDGNGHKWDEASFDDTKDEVATSMGESRDISFEYETANKRLLDFDFKERNCYAMLMNMALPSDHCKYFLIASSSTVPQKLVLEHVPADAYWSITVYNNVNLSQGNSYNQNSSSVKYDSGGRKVTLRFGLLCSNGGDNKCAQNFLEIYDGWRAMLRLYKPSNRVAEWKCPDLVVEEE